MNNLEHLTGEDILYDPRSDTYKIMVGDKTVEVPSSSLRYENLDVLKTALDSTDDVFRKIYLGDWAEAAVARTATEAEEAARAGQTPLRTMDVPWEVHTRGTMGVSVLKPEHPTIIVHSDKKTVEDQPDRYPSIPDRAIIEDAIELLNKNKKLRLHKISLNLNRFKTDYILTVSSRGHTALGKTPVRTMEILINLAIFDRTLKMELDKDAGLKASLDTNTYIKLRIAFLLYKTLSMKDEEAKKFLMVGIFRVMGSTTQFDYSV